MAHHLGIVELGKAALAIISSVSPVESDSR
jgi:hypothetical protein